jgi:hypothetical protein
VLLSYVQFDDMPTTCLLYCLTYCCRLALARVSVLRGSGPAAGTAFIDDYVACVEPVVDYLTRWSGIRPGGVWFT